MSATIIDGAALAKKIKKDIAEQIKAETDVFPLFFIHLMHIYL